MKLLKIFLSLILVAIIGLGFVAYTTYKSVKFPQLVVDTVGHKMQASPEVINWWQGLLGMDKAQTILVLFLNNTEMRPGGGFIGVYAVVRLEKGRPQLLKVEGTEILDSAANKDLLELPPKILADKLKVSKWFFRDSNWSPDFALSAQKALEIYKKEGGIEAENISVVLGFTPTVLEEFLKIIGPIQIEGEQYNAQNFTEKLEYRVEYGYKDQGLQFSERKKFLADLGAVVMDATRDNLFSHWSDYLKLLERMLSEKQIAVYFIDPAWQALAAEKKWTGEFAASSGDYLLWVDANLGALKTDAAIKRELQYTLAASGTAFVGSAKMRYEHAGRFDWRTTRYLTYARVYVPKGSRLISSSIDLKQVDGGVENGRQWFGAFISLEPGAKKDLQFIYELPASLAQKIQMGEYGLLAQKQLGSNGVGLTLGLDFGKKIMSATPGEEESKWGDNKYEVDTDLSVDRNFNIKF